MYTILLHEYVLKKSTFKGAHASLASVYKIEETSKDAIYYRAWKEHSFGKICTAVNSERDLLEVFNRSEYHGIQ